MKTIPFLILIVACFTGCTSKLASTTKEHRGNTGEAVAYDNFIRHRTEELQRMGGPFKDRTAAAFKAQEEASSLFGAAPGDSVTTTWTSAKYASKVAAQEEFTEKLDDMDKEKKGH